MQKISDSAHALATVAAWHHIKAAMSSTMRFHNSFRKGGTEVGVVTAPPSLEEGGTAPSKIKPGYTFQSVKIGPLCSAFRC